MKNKFSNRFYLYLIISLIIHLGLVIFLPYGSFNVLGNNGQEREFSFVQVVEYEPVNNNHANQQTETKEPAEPKIKIEEELEPEPPQEKKPKVESEPEPKPDPRPEPKPEPEPVKETTETNPRDNDMPEKKPEPQVEEKPQEVNNKSNTKKESQSEELMSSENSDVEVATNKENKDEKNAAEEKQTNSEEKNPAQGEEETVEKKEVVKNTPPPPPTAGDLIIGAPVPTYPKDLVGEAVSGTVKLRVHVKTNGQVDFVEVVESSGIDQMDRTARLTLERGWRFNSYSKAYSLVVVVDYQIDKNGNPKVEVTQGNLTFK